MKHVSSVLRKENLKKITVDDVRVKGQSHQLQVLFVAVSRSIMHSTVSFGVAQRWISTIIQQMLHTPESIEAHDAQLKLKTTFFIVTLTFKSLGYVIFFRVISC